MIFDALINMRRQHQTNLKQAMSGAQSPVQDPWGASAIHLSRHSEPVPTILSLFESAVEVLDDLTRRLIGWSLLPVVAVVISHHHLWQEIRQMLFSRAVTDLFQPERPNLPILTKFGENIVRSTIRTFFWEFLGAQVHSGQKSRNLFGQKIEISDQGSYQDPVVTEIVT